MWGIAHAQGIRLPTKDYWEFRDMITVSNRHGHSFDGYLQLFHWTELIQSSPLAVERSVYEVVGGAYRKNNVTTMELRFNPMKRNRGGEQDLDHIIAAAMRGMDRAVARVPDQAGPDPLPGPRLPVPAQRDHRGEGDRLARPRRRRDRHRRARSRRASGSTEYRRLFQRARRHRPRDHRPHRRVGAGRGGRARSSSSSSRTGSATASRRPTTRARWR